jgi:hypothetical protein
MNTNLNTQIPAAPSWSSEGTMVGLFAAALLLARKLFGPKPAKPELLSRSDFYAEMLLLKDQIHADHLALLEKLDAHHREILATLERQAIRLNTFEAGLARLDERTSEGG